MRRAPKWLRDYQVARAVVDAHGPVRSPKCHLIVRGFDGFPVAEEVRTVCRSGRCAVHRNKATGRYVVSDLRSGFALFGDDTTRACAERACRIIGEATEAWVRYESGDPLGLAELLGGST